jgi:hypothetical protein
MKLKDKYLRKLNEQIEEIRERREHDLREKSYLEMFNFINWFANKEQKEWIKLCKQYTKEQTKNLKR